MWQGSASLPPRTQTGFCAWRQPPQDTQRPQPLAPGPAPAPCQPRQQLIASCGCPAQRAGAPAGTASPGWFAGSTTKPTVGWPGNGGSGSSPPSPVTGQAPARSSATPFPFLAASTRPCDHSSPYTPQWRGASVPRNPHIPGSRGRSCRAPSEAPSPGPGSVGRRLGTPCDATSWDGPGAWELARAPRPATALISSAGFLCGGGEATAPSPACRFLHKEASTQGQLRHGTGVSPPRSVWGPAAPGQPARGPAVCAQGLSPTPGKCCGWGQWPSACYPGPDLAVWGGHPSPWPGPASVPRCSYVCPPFLLQRRLQGGCVAAEAKPDRWRSWPVGSQARLPPGAPRKEAPQRGPRAPPACPGSQGSLPSMAA